MVLWWFSKGEPIMAYRKGPTVQCLKCGNGFHVVPARAETAKYCSKECKYADRKAETKLTKTCKRCAKVFQTWRAQDNDFCSYNCAWKAKEKKIRKNCAYCHKPFWIKRTEVETLCCSWECRINRLHSRMGPRSNPRFWKIVRTTVLERDGWTCQGCRLVSFNGKSLHVHHRIHRKNGGTEELENLITLCDSCHKAEHNKKEKVNVNSNSSI